MAQYKKIPIYFDEAGFTGNDLMNTAQPNFTAAAVSVEEDRAKELILEVKKKYRLQGNELKSKNILQHSSGQAAALEILQKIDGMYTVLYCEKRFILAAKFMEYMIEPVIQEKNSWFYGIGFQKFIASLLTISSYTRSTYGSQLLANFYGLMRGEDCSQAAVLKVIDLSPYPPKEDPLFPICSFIRGYSGIISKELESIFDSPDLKRWILDVSTTSLYSMLVHWDKPNHLLSVKYDSSKPISEGGHMLNAFVGNDKDHHFDFFSHQVKVSYRLDKNIEQVDSKKSHSIQLADVAAGSALFAFKKPCRNIPLRDALLKNLSPIGLLCCDADDCSLKIRENKLKYSLLHELSRRAENQESPIKGLEKMILDIARKRK